MIQAHYQMFGQLSYAYYIEGGDGMIFLNGSITLTTYYSFFIAMSSIKYVNAPLTFRAMATTVCEINVCSGTKFVAGDAIFVVSHRIEFFYD